MDRPSGRADSRPVKAQSRPRAARSRTVPMASAAGSRASPAPILRNWAPLPQRRHWPHRLSLHRAHYPSRRPCQGVKDSRLISIARLWWARARLPLASLFSPRRTQNPLRGSLDAVKVQDFAGFFDRLRGGKARCGGGLGALISAGWRDEQPPSASYGPSRSVAATGRSPALMKADGGPRPSTRLAG